MMKKTLLALPVASMAALCAYSAPALAHEEAMFIDCEGSLAPRYIDLGAHINLNSVVRIQNRKNGRFTIVLSNGESFDEREGECTLVRPQDLPIIK